MTENNNNAIVVFITVPDTDCGDKLAHALVERKLAACVNVVRGLVSHYQWKGELCRDNEALLMIKTTYQRLEALIQAIKDLHPYELPEIIALPIIDGLKGYLDWVKESVKTD